MRSGTYLWSLLSLFALLTRFSDRSLKKKKNNKAIKTHTWILWNKQTHHWKVTQQFTVQPFPTYWTQHNTGRYWTWRAGVPCTLWLSGWIVSDLQSLQREKVTRGHTTSARTNCPTSQTHWAKSTSAFPPNSLWSEPWKWAVICH